MTVRRISGDTAATRALAERSAGSCLACAIVAGDAGPVHLIHRGDAAIVVLNRYPRAWGQVMVIASDHRTRFGDLPATVWAEMSELARVAAGRIEARLDPLRVFVSSLGSHRDDLPMTTPHLHLHVDPIFDPEDRPRTVFTAAHGLLEADPEDWEGLRALLAW